MKWVLRSALLAGAAVVALSTTTLAGTKVAPDTSDSSYRKGSVDRDGWEAWIGNLSGDVLAGASYWAENRSHNPLSCAQISLSYQWLMGCNEAVRRLTPIDFWRSHDAQYWNGWNKKVAAPAFVPGIPGEVSYAPTASYLPITPPTPEASARQCADFASQQTGVHFDAYYDEAASEWKTLGGNGGIYYFGKCMTARGYSLTQRN